MSEIKKKVAQLFEDVDKDMTAEQAAEFVQTLASGFGVFVAMHYSERHYGTICAGFSQIAEKSAIITETLNGVIGRQKGGIHVVVMKNEK
ncbi:hypothetical protein [Paenibacillus herberti]|uniref:Uncharacterized protein n=1 Tax=Paenibacillus herberti TaxID=1619309 RepID=A0A229P4Y1_9BACL|nr:hypothetical protein [Paenibacillus herberti]OXM17346.1 hypothetical protein CGZ75_12295 [Paenibacillus herberti]